MPSADGPDRGGKDKYAGILHGQLPFSECANPNLQRLAKEASDICRDHYQAIEDERLELHSRYTVAPPSEGIATVPGDRRKSLSDTRPEKQLRNVRRLRSQLQPEVCSAKTLSLHDYLFNAFAQALQTDIEHWPAADRYAKSQFKTSTNGTLRSNASTIQSQSGFKRRSRESDVDDSQMKSAKRRRNEGSHEEAAASGTVSTLESITEEYSEMT